MLSAELADELVKVGLCPAPLVSVLPQVLDDAPLVTVVVVESLLALAISLPLFAAVEKAHTQCRKQA